LSGGDVCLECGVQHSDRRPCEDHAPLQLAV
jgi:hypothetical protein